MSEQRLAKLRTQLKTVSDDLVHLEAEMTSPDLAARHFIARLRIAADNATGCALLAEAGLTSPLATVTRSMLESLMTTYWHPSTMQLRKRLRSPLTTKSFDS